MEGLFKSTEISNLSPAKSVFQSRLLSASVWAQSSCLYFFLILKNPKPNAFKLLFTEKEHIFNISPIDKLDLVWVH